MTGDYLELRLYRQGLRYKDGEPLGADILKGLMTVVEGELKAAMGMEELSRWVAEIGGKHQAAMPFKRGEEL